MLQRLAADLKLAQQLIRVPRHPHTLALLKSRAHSAMV
jgi:hypothetical protein